MTVPSIPFVLSSHSSSVVSESRINFISLYGVTSSSKRATVFGLPRSESKTIDVSAPDASALGLPRSLLDTSYDATLTSLEQQHDSPPFS